MTDYIMERYDELLVPFNRLAVEIMWDIPSNTGEFIVAWKEYINSLNEIYFLLFPVPDGFERVFNE